MVVRQDCLSAVPVAVASLLEGAYQLAFGIVRVCCYSRRGAHYLVVAALEGLAKKRLFASCGAPVLRDKAECCFRCRLYTAPASGNVACTTADFTNSFTMSLCFKELLSSTSPSGEYTERMSRQLQSNMHFYASGFRS